MPHGMWLNAETKWPSRYLVTNYWSLIAVKFLALNFKQMHRLKTYDFKRDTSFSKKIFLHTRSRFIPLNQLIKSTHCSGIRAKMIPK